MQSVRVNPGNAVYTEAMIATNPMLMSLSARVSLLFMLVIGGALATSLVPSNEWPDPQSQVQAGVFHSHQDLDIHQIQQIAGDAWQLADARSINYGFSTHTFWFRLDIADFKLDNSERWMLELKYPLLDHVSLYVVKQQQVMRDFQTGNSLPFSSRPVAVPEFVFPLSGLQEADQIYIRVKSDSSIQLPIRLYSENSYWQQRVPKVTFDAAFYAVLASMIIYNLLIYILSRDSIFLLYSLTISSFATLMAAMHGWTFALIWPETPGLNDPVVMLALAATAASMSYFGLSFLRLKSLNPTTHNIFMAYTWISVIAGVLSFFVPYAWMIRILAALAVIMSMSGLINGAYLWYSTHSRDVMLFFLAFTLLIFGFLIYSLQKFGIVPVSMVTEHAIEIGAMAQVILLALSMAERHNRERQARLAAQDVIINMQREANELLDLKVKERTEDLEKANQRLLQESTTDALTQIGNRRHFDQQFYTLYHDALREAKPLSLLLVDIDHFKNFNDQHGHQLGDLVLQKVAACMNKIIKRPMDEVYRYGGEEFAVLLPDTHARGAHILAEELRRQIEQLRVNYNDQELAVTISIGCHSQIPSAAEQHQHHYELADQALYQAKHDGRNCVRVSNTEQHSLTAGQ